MIFRKLALGLGLRSSFLVTKITPVSFVDVPPRHFHEVKHKPRKRVFYITLDEFDRYAILYYRKSGKVMDLRAINVPKKFNGRGIARLLTETAFTYAIENDFYLFLTCSYIQKYYLANKNKELEKRIIGPKEVLNANSELDLNIFSGISDPEDSKNK